MTFLATQKSLPWGVPVDQPNGNAVFTGTRLHLNAVAKHFVHRPVAVIQAFAAVTGHLGKFVQGAVDEGIDHATGLQPGAPQGLVDVAVVAVDPVA